MASLLSLHRRAEGLAGVVGDPPRKVPAADETKTFHDAKKNVVRDYPKVWGKIEH